MEAEIPIWMSGQQIIMKGVDCRTTCGEVIAALVGSKASQAWTMVERWKGVERNLAHKARILKLWNQWASEKDQVKLSIRQLAERRPRKGKVSRHNIERLLKLILAQGESIQSRLHNLSTDDDTCPPPSKHSSSSNNRLEPDSLDKCLTSDSEQISQLLEFYERIVKVNKKLEKQEELLVKIHVQIERHVEKDKTAILGKLKQMKIQNDNWYNELESNARSLTKVDSCIREKTEVLQYLYKELHQSGLETARLMEIKNKINSTPEVPKEKEISSDGDTNSDTGLSSLHSSSEEGTYVIASAL